MPCVGILFGTHNRESAKLVLSELVKNGLAKPLLDGKSFEDSETIIGIKPETVERVAIAQLYGESVEQQNPVPLHWPLRIGMSDDLTQYLVNRTKASTPFIIK